MCYFSGVIVSKMLCFNCVGVGFYGDFNFWFKCNMFGNVL